MIFYLEFAVLSLIGYVGLICCRTDVSLADEGWGKRKVIWMIIQINDLFTAHKKTNVFY